MAVPTTAGPDAVYPDPLITTYTLKALNDEGYINCNTDDQLPSLEPCAGAGASVRLWERQTLLAEDPDEDQVGENGQLRKGEPYHVHPTLQRNQWIGLSDRDWQAILPSVELASRFLDDPAITPFFHGMENNVTRLDDPIHQAAHKQLYLQRWDCDNSILGSEEKIVDALFAMMTNRDCIKLVFTDEGESNASTGWFAGRASIYLHQDFLFVLRQDPGKGAQNWSQPWVPGTHEPSARLRTRVQLAITIVHELAHCAWYIQNLGTDHPEPYLRDRPVNELGWELEHFIWTGIIESSGRGNHISAPYGLYIERFPGRYDICDANRKLLPRGTAQDWGVSWTTQYPISMEWCRILFTKDHWEEVSRFGFARVRPRREKGVRLRYPKYPKARIGDDTMNPRSRALLQLREDRRARAMKIAVRADNVDSSDEEDVGPDSIVVRGRHKEALRKQREAAEDAEMPDA